MERNYDRQNQYCFGLGTIGRDMFYAMESMYLMVYLSEVLTLPNSTLLLMTGILTVMRLFDACNDPVMGVLVDNTRSAWGKFKPGIALGAVLSAVFMVLMFRDNGLGGIGYAVFFALCYLGWDISYGLNDIAYWSLLPALSTDQKSRERIGAFARICANIGLFTVVVGIIPATKALGAIFGSPKQGWFVFAIIVALLMIGFQLITLFGVRETKGYFKPEEKTSFREMFRVIFKNDQLLWVAAAMALFIIGYTITANFGVHFFKYIYGDENMYSVFALVLGLSQLSALSVFPLLRKKFSRRRLFSFSTALVATGYLVFFFSPMNMMIIGAGGVLIFVGEAFIQILMLMFLADTIEYGQWKMGKRNESITFSVQPFIYKIGGALANGVLGLTLVASGVNDARGAGDLSATGTLGFKGAMLLLPLALIGLSYCIYLRKFKIDEGFYGELIAKLKARGDIANTAQ
jgi:melibiose permease/lactose/raffinose/galactose permease